MKISKQFGLLPLNVVWETFECPNMLIPSNPAPEDSLTTTSEMITLYVCRTQRVVLDMYFLKYEEPAKFSSSVDIDGKYAPQKEKCSLATLRVVILMNANPSDPVHRIALFDPLLEESDPISENIPHIFDQHCEISTDVGLVIPRQKCYDCVGRKVL